MKKQLLSILLCLIMVVGLLPTAVLAEETAPTFDLATDLAGITIPDDLVTCICTTANESKKYGQLPGGFSASKIEKEYGVWTVIISVANETYLKQFNQDMDCEHDPDLKNSTEIINQIQFKLKYEGGKWELLGEMPKNKMLHFTCTDKHTAQSPAPVLELDFRSINIIKVKPLGNAYEYRIDNGEWQDLYYFENLQPGGKYTITARAKETATHKPGAVSEPLTVATLFDMIPDDLKDKLTAVVSAYKAEYDGMEHEAVIVDMRKMPEGWSIAGHTAGTGDDFVSQIPKIRNVSGSNLTVKTKFTHPDYGQSLIVYSYPKITPKPVTAGMIADIPPQRYTGQSIYPTPEIKDGDMVLVKGKDFTYSYDTNTSPEQGGKVTINGMGNYKSTAFKTFTIVSTITEDDLAGLNIPANLVTVKCQTTGDSKAYGAIPDGFTLGKPYMEGGVLKAVVSLNLPVYKDKYDTDTKKTHEYAGLEGNPHAAFTLKYVNDKWELDGNFPAVVLLVTCNGSHENQTYTVTFNGNGGVPSVTSMTTIDQKLPELPTATHSGRYSFDGWYTEKNGGTKITTATLFDKDTTVYAHWTYTGFTGSGGGVTTYPITVLNAKNGTVAASHKTAPKGATITLTVAPDKDFVMDGLAVVDGAGAAIKLTDMGNGKYTFIMPASKVTVEGSFKEEFPDFPNPFSDIAPSDFCCDAVMWAVAKDITNGIGNYTFAPNQPCTRAQIVTFLWRAASSPAPKSASNFTDVPADAYYAKAVAWAVENGITGGTGDGKFSPDATCTRAQAVTFLYRASGSPAVSGNAAFTDVAADAYYAAAVTWAEKNGITGGIGGGLFGSDQSCTRGQIVTFLYRARNK